MKTGVQALLDAADGFEIELNKLKGNAYAQGMLQSVITALREQAESVANGEKQHPLLEES